ncbi:hypothetical protein [Streptomyces enissocaesilis]|uniref:Ricin B lectin domain-containing protein n=1 Tax=Streptomyces enissocaesilis TaxID=332589 RepID=A0ABN3WLW5_9ACTN
MHKSFTAAVSALAVSTALLAGASAAQAETAQHTGQSKSSVVAVPAQASGWAYHSWYFSFTNCHAAGGELARTNPNVLQYMCEEESKHIWHLHVNWR